MPGKGGTRPLGKKPITDEGRKLGSERNRWRGGKARIGTPLAAGLGGQCICPICDYNIAHVA